MTTITAHAIKEEARRLGFDLCRIIPVGEAAHGTFFEQWIAAGRAGEMTYLTRHGEKRRHPAQLAEAGEAGFRSMVVLGVDYHQFDLTQAVRQDPSRGLIASYAWGADYHEVIRPLLYEVDEFVRSHSGRRSQAKCLVDTGPVLERDWALQAGLGFTGKNCCTIHPGQGSWLFLATILLPEQLDYDPAPIPLIPAPYTPQEILDGLPPAVALPTWRLPSTTHRSPPATHHLATCGRCTRCLDGCPTDAFVGPLHLDPLRCISYWTIESRRFVPRELRPLFGNRIFGCDVCQEVCPWNRRLPDRAPMLAALRAQEDRVAPFLLDGFRDQNPYWLEQAAFSAHFRASPIKRARRSGMARNVCIALGNWAHPVALPALTQALADPEPLVRGHGAWALGQIRTRHADGQAGQTLMAGLLQEADERVQVEIRLALA